MEGDDKLKTIIIQDSSEATKKQKQEIDRLESEATKKQKQVIIQKPPPPKSKRPIVVDLPPSLSPTYTYDVDAFPYLPGLSTAGFFSSSGRAFRFLRPYPNLNLPLPSFFNLLLWPPPPPLRLHLPHHQPLPPHPRQPPPTPAARQTSPSHHPRRPCRRHPL